MPHANATPRKLAPATVVIGSAAALLSVGNATVLLTTGALLKEVLVGSAVVLAFAVAVAMMIRRGA